MAGRKSENRYYEPSLFDEDAWFEKADIIEQALDKLETEESNGLSQANVDYGIYGDNGTRSNLQGDQERSVESSRDNGSNDERGNERGREPYEDIQSDLGFNTESSGRDLSGLEHLGERYDGEAGRDERGSETDLSGLREQGISDSDTSASELESLGTKLENNGENVESSNSRFSEEFIRSTNISNAQGGRGDEGVYSSTSSIRTESKSVSFSNNRVLDESDVSVRNARDNSQTLGNGSQNGRDSSGGFNTQTLFDETIQESEGSGLFGLGNIQGNGSSGSHGSQNSNEVSNELGQQSTDKERLGDFDRGESVRGELRERGSEELAGSSSNSTQEIQSGEVLRRTIGQDFVSDSEVLIGGAVDKYTKNYEAIKLTQELIKEKKKALENGLDFTITKEQQEVIAQFSGWGDGRLANALFNVEDIDWSERRQKLMDLLGEEQYAEAKAASLSAYYTPKVAVKAIYKALDRLGLNQDDGNEKKILEPSAGNGAFLQYGFPKNYKFTTNELDPLSSNMLTLLYPNQEHYSRKFQALQTASKFDAVIGNPPYSSESVSDSNLNNSDLHGEIADFFVAKSVRSMLKDDGIVAFVISSKFMDKRNPYMKELIDKEATFLGAVRLPNNTFKNAGTEVTTDIVFLQKGKNSSLPQIDWTTTEDVNVEGENFTINKYFKEHPENILGNLAIGSAFGGRHELSCKADKDMNLEEALDRFVNTLPENVYKWHENKIDQSILEIPHEDKEYKERREYFESLKPGHYFVYNGEIYKKLESSGKDGVFEVEKADFKYKSHIKYMEQYIKIRDSYNALIKLENTEIQDDDPKLLKARAELNAQYDEFHKKFGGLRGVGSTKGVEKLLSKDVDGVKITMLDLSYDDKEEKYIKAPILSRRVNTPLKNYTFDNIEDGLDVSINLFGKPNINYIADFLGLEPEKVAEELIEKNKVFIDPGALMDKGQKEYAIAAQYLSGDVREKLKIAQRAAQTYPTLMWHNTKQLEGIIPPDLKSSEIEVSMGASWIPMKYYHEFFESELGIDRKNWALQRNSQGWIFEGNAWALTDFNRKRLSVGDYGAFDICKAALQNESIIIKKNTDEPMLDQLGNIKLDKNGRVVYKKEVDREKTSEINNIIAEVRKHFKDWVFKDAERRQDLEFIYNDTFNCYVKKTYDGSKLELNNLDVNIKLRKHQKDAVFRAINEQNCLFDHEVGAGKTLSAICSVMKQKQLGIINKPLITVLKSTLAQWQGEFMKAYPNANILVASEDDLKPKEKDRFLARIQNSDWDAVIITHENLTRIPVPKEVELKIISDHIEELEDSIYQAEAQRRANGESSGRSIKIMQLRLKGLREKLEKSMTAVNKSKTLDFSELGIDCLVVDEAHMFKNLPFSTHLKVKGLGNTAGSDRALMMETITTYMNENNKKILFLTGTPISNSLSELFVMNKYLAPKDLVRKGMRSFDDWAADFAKIEHVPELDTTAQKYQLVSRFTALENLPEACGIYTDFADVITNDDIKKYNANYVPSTEIVKNVSPINDLTQLYIGIQDPETGKFNEGSVCDRMDRFKQGGYDAREDNPLKCTNDAKQAGLDYRLIDPEAPDDPNSKINKCVENIIKEYHEWEADKGTQLVFLDVGTPKTNSQLTKHINLDVDGKVDEESLASEEIKDQLQNLGLADDLQDRKSQIVNGLLEDNEEAINQFAQVGKTDETNRKLLADKLLQENMTHKKGEIDPEEYKQFLENEEYKKALLEKFIAALDEKNKGIEGLSDIYGDDDKDVEQSEDRDAGINNCFLYGDIHRKLLQAGIPREQIAFIHDTGDSYSKKAELSKKVNSGEIRVLIGSTSKMGVGLNVQERVTAIHHIDVPWRPADLVQRNGRVIRQGNKLFERDPENFKIKEFRYVTERTYDAVSWQIVESKAKGLANFRKGTNNNRTLSGFEEDAASAAEMKAIATGNPLLIEEVKLKAELEKLRLQEKLWTDKIHDAEDGILANQRKKEYLTRQNQRLKQAADLIRSNSNLAAIEYSMFSTDASYEIQKHDFSIPKENKDKEQEEVLKAQKKQMEDLFSRNVSDIFSGVKSRDFLEYKGFIVSGHYDSLSKKAYFELRDKTGDISFAPENLEYSPKVDNGAVIPVKAQLVLSGFLRRIDNFLNPENMENMVKENMDKIIRGDQNAIDLNRFISENNNFDLKGDLELAEREYKTLLKELEMSSKNPKYKSEFRSEILQKLDRKNGTTERVSFSTTLSKKQKETREIS